MIQFLVSIAIAISALAFAYNTFIYTPNKDREIRSRQMENEIYLKACLKTANDMYSVGWDINCQSLSLNNKCKLPSNMIESLDKELRNDKNDCYKQYPVSNPIN